MEPTKEDFKKKVTSGIGAKKGAVSVGIYFKEFAQRITVGEMTLKVRDPFTGEVDKVKTEIKARRRFVKGDPAQTDAHDPAVARELIKNRSVKKMKKTVKQIDRLIASLDGRRKKLESIRSDMNAVVLEIESKFSGFEANGILVSKEVK